jgi:hypothetical protein
MTRRLVTLVLLALCATPLRADVRVTSTTTLEGAFAAMMGGMTPRIVMHIKGLKARTDMDMGGQSISTIADIDAKQFVILNSAQKTAQIMTPESSPVSGGVPLGMPKIDADVKPTGKSQLIAGVSCEEMAISMSMTMAEMAANSQMPAEASEMMKSIRLAMAGRMWVAKSGPGVAEYMAFQSASTKGDMVSMMASIPGMKGSGIDRLMGAFSNAGGIPYLTELSMTIEGNAQIAEMMKQQGPIKIITKVTEVSTDPIPDDLFTVPVDYKILK